MGERSQSKALYLLLPPVTLRTRYDNALPLARGLQWADAPGLFFCCRIHGRTPRLCASVTAFLCTATVTIPSSAQPTALDGRKQPQPLQTDFL